MLDATQQSMQTLVGKAFDLHPPQGLDQVIAVEAGPPARPNDDLRGALDGELAGVLRVGRISHERVRGNLAVRRRHRQAGGAVRVRNQLAFVEVRLDRGEFGRRDPERQPLAGATRGEAEDQPRFLRRTSIVMRIDAERAMVALQHRRQGLLVAKARSPHQRSIAEYPIALIVSHVVATPLLSRFTAYSAESVRVSRETRDGCRPLVTATAMCTCTAIVMSTDTANWRIRTNTFTSTRMRTSIRTSIGTRIRTNMARASTGRSTSIRDTVSRRTIMLTNRMISNRMVIGTRRPDARFGRWVRDRRGDSPLADARRVQSRRSGPGFSLSRLVCRAAPCGRRRTILCHLGSWSSVAHVAAGKSRPRRWISDYGPHSFPP